MKISHGELEQCLQQPRAWLRENLITASHGWKMGYHRALLLSIYRYHKTKQTTVARQYLHDIIQRHQFKNITRIDEIEVAFESYVKWCETQNIAVADSRVRIGLGSGYLTLAGEVHRVDVTPEFYRAVLLGSFPANWHKQMRMPLIQRAISEQFARPLDEVAVAVQQLDGSNLQVHSYSAKSIRRTEGRFKELARQLERYSRAFPVNE